MHPINNKRPRRVLSAVVLAIATMTPATAFAQERTPDRPGRFVMSPVDGGFVRLDTETGTMSLCKAQPQGSATWACQPMGDTAAETQGRVLKLEGENKDLRAEIKRMEDQLGLAGPQPKVGELPVEPRPGGRTGGMTMPSEEDIDKALSYMERMMKKFHDTMKRLEGHDGRKGTQL